MGGVNNFTDRDSQVRLDINRVGARLQALVRAPSQVEPKDWQKFNADYREHFRPNSRGYAWVPVEVIASLSTNLNIPPEDLIKDAVLPESWNAKKFFESQPSSMIELVSAIAECCYTQDDLIEWAQAIREGFLSQRVKRVQSRLSHKTEWERYRRAS